MAKIFSYVELYEVEILWFFMKSSEYRLRILQTIWNIPII